MEPSTQQSSSALPIAIIVGFAMIALAIFLTSGRDSELSVNAITQDTQNDEDISTGIPRTVDETDYIKGNPNAPILMVEYSDYDCPFCKQYQTTLNQIMNEYGVTGQVAWVYRQYPLAQLHPNSPKISEAALCVGEIGGNEAFWKFTDLVYEKRDVTEQTNVTKLPDYAVDAGVTKEEYIACLDSRRMKGAVEASIADGFNAGVRGTPYTVLIVGNQQAIIDGAQPYEVVKGIIVNLIDQLEGNFDTESVQTETIAE